MLSDLRCLRGNGLLSSSGLLESGSQRFDVLAPTLGLQARVRELFVCLVSSALALVDCLAELNQQLRIKVELVQRRLRRLECGPRLLKLLGDRVLLLPEVWEVSNRISQATGLFVQGCEPVSFRTGGIVFLRIVRGHIERL